MSKSALLQKKDQIERAREAWLKNIGDAKEYTMCWWRAHMDMKLLKGSGVRWIVDESECIHKQQRFDDDVESTDEYLGLFRIGVAIRVVQGVLEISVKIRDDAGEVGGRLFGELALMHG